MITKTVRIEEITEPVGGFDLRIIVEYRLFGMLLYSKQTLRESS